VLGCAACLLAQPGVPAQEHGPASLPLLDVPFISQSEALCGGAAAAMVLRYWGERGVAAESFSHLVDRSAAGIRTGALVADLRLRGWTAIPLDGSEDRVRAELSRSRPVLALVEDRPEAFHYVVIVAWHDRGIVFHDPARAPFRVMAKSEFDRRWRAGGRWMAVVLPAADRDRPPSLQSGRSATRPASAG
jgi:ABC-type bacteriocin/lantibiotic exporter with double-glycine peptidase domain